MGGAEGRWQQSPANRMWLMRHAACTPASDPSELRVEGQERATALAIDSALDIHTTCCNIHSVVSLAGPEVWMLHHTLIDPFSAGLRCRIISVPRSTIGICHGIIL